MLGLSSVRQVNMWYVGVFKLKNYFYGIWNYSCHGSITKIHFFFSFFGNDCRGSYNIIRCPVHRNFAEIAKIRNSLHTGLAAEPKQCTGFKTG